MRYYVGHKGKFGHEFLEFEFRPDGECCLAVKLRAIVSSGEANIVSSRVLGGRSGSTASRECKIDSVDQHMTTNPTNRHLGCCTDSVQI